MVTISKQKKIANPNVQDSNKVSILMKTVIYIAIFDDGHIFAN